MTEYQATRASSDRHILAEGPVWIADLATVIWVDIEKGSVFTGRLSGTSIIEISRYSFEGQVGAAVPGDDGSLLVATHDRLVRLAPDGHRTDGPIIVSPGTNSRANDGACDPAGRFLVGTLALDDREGQEVLYRWETNGSLTTMDSDLTLSNGLAWSPDGTLMYSTDTVPGIIWVRDYDVASGEFGSRRHHLHITQGFPDGICVDSRGYLWVAIWGEGEVRSFTPSGIADDTVRVPAPHVSSVAFVGADLNLLLITTASRDLSPAELEQHPDAGCLFIAELPTAGFPSTLWASSALAAFVR